MACTLQRKVSVEMKVLESLAYNSTEPTVLLNLLGKIKELQTDIRSSLPHAEGLLLRPVSLLKTARKIKQKYKCLVDMAASYSSLEPTGKRGRKRQYWKLQRVGIKAAKLRQSASNAPPLALHTTSSTLPVAKSALTTGNTKVLNTDRRCTQGG